MHKIVVDILRAPTALSATMHPRISVQWTIAALVGLLATACSSPSGECTIAADCASGICDTNGQCNNNGTADGAPGDGSVDVDAALSACSSVVDGIITRDELPMAAGLSASFRVATSVTFDTAGTMVAETRTWDMDRPLANDVDVEVVLSSLAGTWYEELFPTASYTGLLGGASDLIGVFRLADDGLYLLGVVSPEDGLSRTELKYDPVVLLMPLPLSQGATWSTDAEVSGLASGIFSFFTESYAGSADASGSLLTPFGVFRTLRTRIDLTQTIGLLVTTTRQFNFVSECAGIVASIVSASNEENVEFMSAAELRRVIP